MSDTAKVRKGKRGVYIHLWWQGTRHTISTYMGLVSFKDNEALAYKAKAAIDGEIDRGVFRPERWKRRAKKLFNIKGYSETWLDKITSKVSIATHHDYTNSFKNHINPVLGCQYIEDVNLEKLDTLMGKINRTPKGKKNVMGALHRMFDYAHRNGHIIQMPIFPEFEGTDAIVTPEIIWTEPSEIFRILEHIHVRHRPIFTFGTLTGCRVGEARALRKQDVKTDQVTFAVTFGRAGELKEVKGKKIMPFPMSDTLEELFETMQKNLTKWVFISDTGKPYGRNITRIYNRAREKAGISKRLQLKNYFRQSFAMNLLNQEVPKEIVSRLLRHQDPRTIDHYGEYATNPLKSVLDRVQKLPVTYKEKANDSD